jgi:predicted HicB family RNase H-like nuclease
MWYRVGMNEDVHVRVSKNVMTQVRAYAKRQGLSLAAAVTVLLTQALEGNRS